MPLEPGEMTYFSRLSKTVSDETSSGRVGTPVFARLVMAILQDHGSLLPALGEGVVFIEQILRAPVKSLFASGAVELGHVSLQLHCAGSRTALVSQAGPPPGRPRVDLLLVGNHGTVRHESNLEILMSEAQQRASSYFFEVTPRGRQIQNAIRDSLRLRGPVEIQAEDNQ